MGNDLSRPMDAPNGLGAPESSRSSSSQHKNIRKRISRLDLQRKVKSRASQPILRDPLPSNEQALGGHPTSGHTSAAASGNAPEASFSSTPSLPLSSKTPLDASNTSPRVGNSPNSSHSPHSPISSAPPPSPPSSPPSAPSAPSARPTVPLQPQPTKMIPMTSTSSSASSSFSTQRRHNQRAVSTFSSHTTDSNWTMSGGLFSQIDPASSSTITAITDYSTISKHSAYYQDCDRQLVRSAAEAMAGPSSSSVCSTNSHPCPTTTVEKVASPPPYTSADPPPLTSASSPPLSTSTSSSSTSTTPTPASDHRLTTEWLPLVDQLAQLAEKATPQALSKPSMALTSHLLDQAFGMAAIVRNDKDRTRLFTVAQALCEQSITARVWVARCQLDAWGTPPDPQQGFHSLLHLAESGCWEAFYPLANCYADGVPKSAHDDAPLSASTISSTNDSSSIAAAATDPVQAVNKQEAWRWLHMAAQIPDDDEDNGKKQQKARAQYKIGAIYFDGDALVASDHDKSLHFFMQSANNGNKYAQFIVGFHFEQGILVEKNMTLAKKYYEASASQGSADSQAALGIVLSDEQQFEAGMKWLYDAAQQKNTRALVKLGTLFEHGQGVDKNEQEALRYYKLACGQHDAGAHYVLGLHYRLGSLGLEQNWLEAGRHLNRAARSGFAPAQRLLGLMYLQGLLSGQRHDENEQVRRKAEKTALLWFRRSAAQGDVRALGLVGACYQYGHGVGANYEVALEYYRKAARMVSPFQAVAQIAMAQLLHHMGRHRDAVEWFTKAADASADTIVPLSGRTSSPSRIARLMLARYHLHGWTGVVKDRAKAFAMLTTLAKEADNDAHAHYWLAACYEEGIDHVCPCDLAIAYHHYYKAAQLGDTDAEFQVAFMLSNGKGVPRDRKAAFDWYKKAAARNHKTALYSLGLYYAKGLEGISKDLYQARICFEKAARLGVAAAMTSYATLCRIASLQPGPQQQEQREATLYWYKKAVAAGDITALRELGLLYEAGLGVARDYRTAFDYFEQAARHQDAQSTLLLGHYYQQGHAVEKDLQKALQLYLDAEQQGAHIAPFASAQVYHSLGQFQEAFLKYAKAAKDPRLVGNRVGRTSKLMVARYILSYIPAQDDDDADLPVSFGQWSKQDAFLMIYKLATEERFEQAYCWLAECYDQGNGTDKDDQEAIRWYHKAADGLKDKDAMVKLAMLYEQQTHLPNHATMAFHYFQLAADMGHAEAQHQLGMIYWRGGLNEPINLGEAVCWFTRSAAQKYAASHWALGKMALENGDQDVAIAWWRKSVNLGYEPAKREMARLFLQSTQQLQLQRQSQHPPCDDDGDLAMMDVDHDDHAENIASPPNEEMTRAMELLTEAVANGDAESLAFLGQLHQFKATSTVTSTSTTGHAFATKDDGLSADVPVATATTHASTSTSMVATAASASNHPLPQHHHDDDMLAELRLQQQQQEQGLATRCFEQAAEMGHVESMFLAAESWHSQQQYAAALEYYERAAQHGHLLARVMCARYHLEGHGGLDPDPERGYQELYACAVEEGCVDAYNSLGQCNEMGLGTVQDDVAACDWYMKSAQQTQDAEAMFRIGLLYEHGRVAAPEGQHNDLAALEWYRFAIETRQHCQAHYHTGLYLLQGIQTDDDNQEMLVRPDRQQAAHHFSQAAEQGDANAMFELGQLLLSHDDDTDSAMASITMTAQPTNMAIDNNNVNDDDDALLHARQGIEWLDRASQLDHRDALRELGKLYHSGKECQSVVLVAKDMALAYDYFNRSAQLGDKTAMLFIGIYYEHGFYVAMDLALAQQWYEMASRSGWWLAELAMAQLLHQDMDQREEAYRYFQLAHDHAPDSQRQTAATMIARYQLRGWGGVPIQLQAAANQLIHLATHHQQVKVYLEVAQCYEFGIGVAQNKHEAFQWYQRVIHHHQQQPDALDDEDNEDLAEALFRVAEFYRQGWAVNADQAYANRLYAMAAKQGSRDAQEYMQLHHITADAQT